MRVSAAVKAHERTRDPSTMVSTVASKQHQNSFCCITSFICGQYSSIIQKNNANFYSLMRNKQFTITKVVKFKKNALSTFFKHTLLD